MGTEDERREHLILEERLRVLLGKLPETPVRTVATTGEFWRTVAQLRVSLRILNAMREIADERTREDQADKR
jgi:hypothetical protein